MFDAVEKGIRQAGRLRQQRGDRGWGMKLVDMSAARMKRLFEVNVLGAYLCAREAARRMSKSRGGKGGSIVNISSAASRMGSPENMSITPARKAPSTP